MNPRKKILITAGPTREMLDPVRFLSNLSTGEMGYTLAKVARMKNYDVTLVSGPTSLARPKGVRWISIVSAQDLERVCRREFPRHDILVMTAAVCDFTAAAQHRHKIHRTQTKQIRLKRTPDILRGLTRRKGKRIVIGFCLETKDWIRNAELKLKRKNLDGIVANYYHRRHIPFGDRRINTAFLDQCQSIKQFKNQTKRQIADYLLRWVERLWRSRKKTRYQSP